MTMLLAVFNLVDAFWFIVVVLGSIIKSLVPCYSLQLPDAYSLYMYMNTSRPLSNIKHINHLIFLPFSTINVYVISICCLEGHGGTEETS
uniref:Uncharacterized protein n=1 Tax=Arundo donax TaxID=35708 RepID=A0A0A8ZPD0_ARUDO